MLKADKHCQEEVEAMERIAVLDEGVVTLHDEGETGEFAAAITVALVFESSTAHALDSGSWTEFIAEAIGIMVRIICF